jgi:hypothetical protein
MGRRESCDIWRFGNVSGQHCQLAGKRILVYQDLIARTALGSTATALCGSGWILATRSRSPAQIFDWYSQLPSAPAATTERRRSIETVLHKSLLEKPACNGVLAVRSDGTT